MALPIWRRRISPVLDTAMQLLVVETENGRETARREVSVGETEEAGHLRVLTGLGVDLIICCAVSRRLQVELEGRGVAVLAHTCGAVDDVIEACLQNRLAEEAFRMPGCKGLPSCAEKKKIFTDAETP